MDVTLKEIAAAAMPTTITEVEIGKRKSVIIDFIVGENGEIGVFGIEVRNRFSVNVEPPA
jgi:hypothetical protein